MIMRKRFKWGSVAITRARLTRGAAGGTQAAMTGKAAPAIMKIVPSSMINIAKAAGHSVMSAGGGPLGTPAKHTIVIAAPKAGAGVAGSTQFIVVTTRPGGTTTLVQANPAMSGERLSVRRSADLTANKSDVF